MGQVGDRCYCEDEQGFYHYCEVVYIEPGNDDYIVMFDDNDYAGNKYGIKVINRKDLLLIHRDSGEYSSESSEYYSSDESSYYSSDEETECDDSREAIEYFRIYSNYNSVVRELKQIFKLKKILD